MEAELERKVAQLEISVKDIENRLTAIHRDQATVIIELKSLKGHNNKEDLDKRMKEFKDIIEEQKMSTDKKIADFRKHANSILDEIYNSVESLEKKEKKEEKVVDTKHVEEKIESLDKKLILIESMIKSVQREVTNNNSKDLEALRKDLENMKPQNTPTLIKDLSLESQKLTNKMFVIEDSVKELRKKVNGDN